ncbi:hypothetical protein PC119_g12891 [Phytophthora cactorum]|nr:hypothetical protein PC119_g12891 [Phytophthora cactorum]
MELSESEVGQRDHRVGPTTLEVAIQERRVGVSGRIISVVIAVEEVVLDDVVVDQGAVLGERRRSSAACMGVALRTVAATITLTDKPSLFCRISFQTAFRTAGAHFETGHQVHRSPPRRLKVIMKRPSHSALFWKHRCIDDASRDDENVSPNVLPAPRSSVAKSSSTCCFFVDSEMEEELASSAGTLTPPWMSPQRSMRVLESESKSPSMLDHSSPPFASPARARCVQLHDSRSKTVQAHTGTAELHAKAAELKLHRTLGHVLLLLDNTSIRPSTLAASCGQVRIQHLVRGLTRFDHGQTSS